VVFPFYRTYDVLRQSSAACKALKVLKTTVLKRLASAVQLRPWPPYLSSSTIYQSFLTPEGLGVRHSSGKATLVVIAFKVIATASKQIEGQRDIQEEHRPIAVGLKGR